MAITLNYEVSKKTFLTTEDANRSEEKIPTEASGVRKARKVIPL